MIINHCHTHARTRREEEKKTLDTYTDIHRVSVDEKKKKTREKRMPNETRSLEYTVPKEKILIVWVAYWKIVR